MPTLTQSPAWQNLAAHKTNTKFDLPQLLADAARNQYLTVSPVAGMQIDFSRNWLNADTLGLLQQLAQQQQVAAKRDAMLVGDTINNTEQRAVLHTALRAPATANIVANGENVMPAVHAELQKCFAFANQVRNGQWLGATGEVIKYVVNIGIGGSDLGPRLVAQALRPYAANNLQLHFVANIDGTDMANVLAQCNPAQTLFIVASKTFTTIETMTNAQTARQWLVNALGEEAVAKHFVAVSTAAAQVKNFGIDVANMFGFWDWVGGRYSVWSAIGLSVMIGISPENFNQFLSGAHAMDQHFATAPILQNAPMLLGLLAVWYRNFWQLPARACLPYDQTLEFLPRYLQQLDMESLGKRVTAAGEPVDYDTGAIIFGEPGTNGQHAFYQLLHQGTTPVPADFVLVATPHHNLAEHHKILLANAKAQPQALALGDREADNPHKIFPGNRPSNVIALEQLTPFTLGAMLAMYEHSVFTQAAVWDINAFDQFGVELGKTMAKALMA